MPNKNYQRGRRLEWQVKKDYESRGWHVTRASGSHSAYDLIAVMQKDRNFTHIKFIQCKVIKKLTDAALRKLIKEVHDTSPIQHELQHSEFHVDVELAVKEQGTGEFVIYYPLES